VKRPWAIVGVVGLSVGALGSGGDLGTLPDSLADYRSWRPVFDQPQLVPLALAIQCATVTGQQIQGARESHGPHALRWLMVYANPPALAGLKGTVPRQFAPGAVIAKEKRLEPGDSHPEGVAFMVKHPPSERPESDGWEFLYYPAGPPTATVSRCISCHQAGEHRDYVLGTYAPFP
jgi:hypothetical protein